MAPEKTGLGEPSPTETKSASKGLLSVFLFGIISAGVFTWPFVLKLSSYYLDTGDYALNAWTLWYDQAALRCGRVFHPLAYFNSNQFYPWPFSLAYSDHLLVPSLLFSPMYWASHHLPLSFNAAAFLALALSFVSGYWACYYFTRNRTASVLGALIYAFNPMTFARFPGHLQMGKIFLPLLVATAIAYFKSPSFKNAFWFFACFTANALSAVYFEIMSVILLPIVALPFLIHHLKRKNASYFLRLLKSSAVVLIFLPVILAFSLPYVQFSNKEGAIRPSNVQGASFLDWCVSTEHSLIYGKAVGELEKIRLPHRKNLDTINWEYALFTGIVPGILMFAGFLCVWRKVRSAQASSEDRLAWTSLLLALAASVSLTFGPFFLGFNRASGTVKLPYYYLYMHTPLLDGIRVPTRFHYFSYVAFSILAAMGALALLRKTGKAAPYVSALLIALIWLEAFEVRSYAEQSYMLRSDALAEVRRMEFLKNQPTVHIPIYGPFFTGDSAYLTWDTLTNEKILNGYSGYYPDDWVLLIDQVRSGLSRDRLADLHALGFQYVVIHKDLLTREPTQQSYIASHLGLYLPGIVYEDRDTMVLGLNRYGFHVSLCDSNQPASLGEVSLYALDGQPTYYSLKISNPLDCYRVYKFSDRYRRISFAFHGRQYGAYAAFPMLIRPRESFRFGTPLSKSDQRGNPVTDFTWELGTHPVNDR